MRYSPRSTAHQSAASSYPRNCCSSGPQSCDPSGNTHALSSRPPLRPRRVNEPHEPKEALPPCASSPPSTAGGRRWCMNPSAPTTTALSASAPEPSTERSGGCCAGAARVPGALHPLLSLQGEELHAYIALSNRLARTRQNKETEQPGGWDGNKGPEAGGGSGWRSQAWGAAVARRPKGKLYMLAEAWARSARRLSHRQNAIRRCGARR